MRQFLQRMSDLRKRHVRPISNLPPLQFRTCLIPVHRPLRQQTQQHQVRCRQLHSCDPFRTTPRFFRVSQCSAAAPTQSGCLCNARSLHFFPVLRFLLQYHHSHFPAGSLGFFACATAAQKVSSTQGSCRRPVARLSRSYRLFGFCRASCATLRILSNSKSRSIAGPIEIKSPNSRVLRVMKISLTWCYAPVFLASLN